VIIEEKDEKGHVSIYASNQEDMQGAIDRIRAIAAQPEVGEVYKGKVRSIQPYGAFVEIMPGKDGLLHISEVTHERIQTLEGLLEVGQGHRRQTGGDRQEDRQVPALTQGAAAQARGRRGQQRRS
jgi:polyribonucleotide nucleotidyltransferase